MKIEKLIEKVLDEKIRPKLSQHDGKVTFLEYFDGTVLIKLHGACAGCPSADFSTRRFIEETLHMEIEEIKKVELSQSVNEDLLAFARSILT